tara:strand:- start:198 stop:578 length:381 start_codon:yes stop_codon:yes gene_type:complete
MKPNELAKVLKNQRERIEKPIRTVERRVELYDACIMEVAAVSTEPCGGDAGHGALSAFRFTDLAGSCWAVEVVDDQGTAHRFEPRSVHFEVKGDAEQGLLLAALGIVSEVMREAGVKSREHGSQAL